MKSLFLALMLGSTAWPIKSPLANPSGGSVRGGSATITYSPAEVQVNQQSERAIIEWQSFDIAEGERTRFVQPSSSSIALNRVVNSAQASVINGNLSANGKVIVINPNGLIIGGQAHVDTAGFVASSADIADDHFMNGAGTLEFNKAGKLDALVENNGHITINDAGLGALVAPNVRNNGLIEGNLAKIHLAAADTFGVDFYGDGLVHLAVQTNQGGQARQLVAENTGSLVADGGKVVMTAAAVSNVVDSVINTTGYIRAGGLENRNGEIVLTGTGAHVKVKGTVDASGANGGGSVHIGGGTKGLGSLARASKVDIDSGAIVKADANHNGTGGSVVVWSDNATAVHGTLSAKGGKDSGNGGFIETSSEDIVDVSGMTVNTTATNGLTGRWLLDPKNLTVDAELASTINSSRSNVVLEATNKITFSADINIAAKEVGLTATSGDGGIKMTETYIRTNGGAVSFSTTGTITLNGSPKEGTKFLYTRGGAIEMTGDKVTITDAQIGSGGGAVNITATAEPKGNTKTVTITNTKIDTSGGSEIGDIALYEGNPRELHDGKTAEEADFFGKENTFEAEEAGGILSISGQSIGGNNNCFSAGGSSCLVSDPIPVTLIEIIADAQSKVYGSSDPIFTYTYVGDLQKGDIFSGALARSEGDNVGSYEINLGTLELSGSGNYTYTLSYTSNFLDITPYVLSVAAAGKSKVYGSTTPALTYTYGALQNGDTASVFSGSLARSTGENVGSYTINQGSLSAGSNYTIAYTGNNLNITPYTLSVAAASKTKVYGAATPDLTYTYGALQNGDTAAVFNGSLTRAAGENVGSYAIAKGSLSAGSNYTIAYTGNNFNITPYTLTVAAASKGKVYGQSTPDLTYTYGTLQNGDTAAIFNGSLTRVAGENVGSYAISQGNLTAGSNYTIAYTGNNLSITPYALTVAAAGKSKVYGQSTPDLTYTYGALQNGDTAAVFNGNLTRATGENVGSYAISQGSLSAGSNYTINYTGNSFNITPYTLSVVADSKSKVYGAAAPGLTYTYGTLQNGDSAAVFSGSLARTVGENVGSYAIAQGSLSAGSNYTIAYTGNNLNITPYTLTVAATGKSKVYGQSTPDLTYTYGALQNGDTAAVFNGNLIRATGENVGSYAINQGNLSAGSNYTIAYTGNTLNVTPYTLSVAADAKSKVYGQAMPDLTYTYGALQNGDTAAIFNGNLTRVAGENVGSYAISQGNLTAGSNYTIAYTGNNLAITPYTLNVVAGSKSKVYGSATPALTYAYAPLQNGDTDSVFSGSLTRVAGENAGAYAINQGSLSAGSNYNIAYTGSRLNITPYTLSVAATGKSKVYGQSTPNLTYLYGTLQNGDTASVFSGGLSRVAGENVGSYAINQGSLSAGPNYTIAYTGNTLTISQPSIPNIVMDNESQGSFGWRKGSGTSQSQVLKIITVKPSAPVTSPAPAAAAKSTPAKVQQSGTKQEKTAMLEDDERADKVISQN